MDKTWFNCIFNVVYIFFKNWIIKEKRSIAAYSEQRKNDFSQSLNINKKHSFPLSDDNSKWEWVTIW